MLLLPEEPPGTVVSRTPGAMLLRANLRWQERPPREDGLLSSWSRGVPDRGSLHAVCRMTSDTTGYIACELRSFYRRDLSGMLDSVLRGVSSLAAVTGAMLEMAAERLAGARVFSRSRRLELCRSLESRGLSPREAPSLAPVGSGSDLCLGTGSLLDELRRMLLQDGWEVAGVWSTGGVLARGSRGVAV
ncbi:hypothetical protein [Rubrobacter calidifluminis]|uniref:hypothetical protein n=1 Tax=Rubrobacter calidifluminis TaxID=1392640 RepID=UPI00236258F7|nr:hypothetical protein [Rubrobacter calidifluminis]